MSPKNPARLVTGVGLPREALHLPNGSEKPRLKVKQLQKGGKSAKITPPPVSNQLFPEGNAVTGAEGLPASLREAFGSVREQRDLPQGEIGAAGVI